MNGILFGFQKCLHSCFHHVYRYMPLKVICKTIHDVAEGMFY